LNEDHLNAMALFGYLDPTLKRLVMGRAVEILTVTGGDVDAASRYILQLAAESQQRQQAGTTL
jgi:hypothetical protein